jgi:hypothetical protein
MKKSMRRAEKVARRVLRHAMDESADQGLTPYLTALALACAAWTVLDRTCGARGASATFGELVEEFSQSGLPLQLP